MLQKTVTIVERKISSDIPTFDLMNTIGCEGNISLEDKGIRVAYK